MSTPAGPMDTLLLGSAYYAPGGPGAAAPAAVAYWGAPTPAAGVYVPPGGAIVTASGTTPAAAPGALSGLTSSPWLLLGLAVVAVWLVTK